MLLYGWLQVSRMVPGLALSIDREGHMHSFCCTEAGSLWAGHHVATLIKNQIAKWNETMKGNFIVLCVRFITNGAEEMPANWWSFKLWAAFLPLPPGQARLCLDSSIIHSSKLLQSELFMYAYLNIYSEKNLLLEYRQIWVNGNWRYRSFVKWSCWSLWHVQAGGICMQWANLYDWSWSMVLCYLQ